MYISKKNIISAFTVLISSAFFFAEVFRVVVAENFRMLSYVVGVAAYFYYLFSWRKVSPSYFGGLFYQIFYFVGILVSAFAISMGARMYEIAEDGLPNGVFWLIVIYSILSIEFGYFGFLFSRNSFGKFLDTFSVRSQKFLAYIFLLFIFIVSSYLLARYGGAFFSEFNRVQYWGQVAPSHFSFIRILIIPAFYYVAVFFIDENSKASKAKLYLFVFLYIFMSVFLLGEKFSLFVMFIHAWLFVGTVLFRSDYLFFVAGKVFIVLITLLAAVALIYSSMGLGYDFVFSRIALQGQVLWSVLQENFQFLVIGTDWGNFFGMEPKKFMAMRYLPSFTFEASQESGTSLSGYFPAMIIFYFGIPLSLIIVSALSWILGYIQGKAFSAVLKSKFLFGFLWYTVYFYSIAFLYAGNLNLIFVILVLMGMLFMYKIIFYRVFKRFVV